jgi:alkylation response protein AidB-like acyl-CoA dehydrogenase
MIWINNWVDVDRALRPVLEKPDLDRELRVRAGRLMADAAAIRFTGLRSSLGRMAGRPVPEFFVLKLLGSETAQAAAQLALDAPGLPALTSPELFLDRVESLGATIYGGTSEIQRNIIGERVLRLPRDR